MNARFIEGLDGKIRIYPSRWKVALLLFLSAAFLGFGIWVLIYAPAVDVGLTFTFSYVGIPLFAITSVVLFRKLLDRDPAFEIDSAGVVGRSSSRGFGDLRWDQIDFVVAYTTWGQRVLGFIPTDLQPFLDTQGVLKGFVVKLRLVLGIAPVNIPEEWLPMTVEELADLLHTRFGVRVDA